MKSKYKKVKVSVIGVGHLGKIHTRLWKQNPAVDLIGVFDIDKPRANQIAKEFECKAFNSIDDVIEQSDICTIASNTESHYRIARTLIENGINCFIEKPIADTYNNSQKIIELAQKHNVLIQVGHVERFNPALLAIKDHKLNPLFIEVHRLSQFRPRAIDVSVVHDLMIHDIDILLWLVNSKVKSIVANGVALLTKTADIANARITFENGAVANLTASRISANNMRKFRIFQPDGYFSIDFGNQKVEIFELLDNPNETKDYSLAMNLGAIMDIPNPKTIVYAEPEVPKINAIQEEQNAFVLSVTQGLPIAVTAIEATEAVRIAEIINKKIKKYQSDVEAKLAQPRYSEGM